MFNFVRPTLTASHMTQTLAFTFAQQMGSKPWEVLGVELQSLYTHKL